MNRHYLPNLPYHPAQCRQDEFVDDFFYASTGGFFVEVGAHDGKTISNTVFLEHFRAWTGICVEANAETYKELAANRPNTVFAAVGTEAGDVPMTCIVGECSGLSAVSKYADLERQDWGMKTYGGRREMMTAPGLRLDSIIDGRLVHYLSIDTDGAELDVIESMGDERPILVSVENIIGGGLISDAMVARGYVHLARTGWDDFYIRKEIKLSSMKRNDRGFVHWGTLEEAERSLAVG